MSAPKIELAIGQKYARLSAIHCLNKKDSRYRILWEFQCDCGNKREASASDVLLGRIKSCGCLQLEYSKSSLKPTIKPNQMGPKNKLYGRYRREAIQRGYSFDISIEDFLTIVFQNCFYCGDAPSTKMNMSKKFSDRNVFLYNGLDRKNKSIGYSVDNCVPSCYVCNKMKMTLSSDIFIAHVNKISTNLENSHV